MATTEIEQLQLTITSNSANATKGIDELARSLRKLNSATKGAKGLSTVATNIKKVSRATKEATDRNKLATKSFTDFYYKMRIIANGIRQVGQAISSAIKKSSDYVENVNLFTVSMGEYADEAKEYAEVVGEAMGIDPGEWMRNQGVFMTLATGFGVAGDRAAVMSKNLTQLGYDLSSFFNISYEEAMQKLQSGLAGELEPLRRIGYDLSQAKLEATALGLGITKSVANMTQAEKAQLRYYAILTQVTTAQGDMARTLTAPANQIKVFKAQLNMAAREIGNVFIPALNAVLPYAIAVTKVIRTLASIIASLVGFEMPEIDYSGVNSMVSVAEDTGDAMDEATDSAKKLKSYMLGFDELNVINPKDESSGAEDALGGFDFELPEYDFLEGLVDTKIDAIVEDMKEWLGLTEDIDTWAEFFDTKLGKILKTVGLIGAGLAAWKIGVGLVSAITGISTALKIIAGSKFIGWLTAFISLSKEFGFVATFSVAFPKLSAALAALAPVALPIAGIIGGIVSFIWGLVDAIKEGITWINAIAMAIGTTLAGAGIGFLIGGPIGAAIGALVGFIVGLITDLVILIVQKWDEISAWFVGVGKWINTNVIQPVVGFFKWLWEKVSGFFSSLWDGIVAIWSVVSTWFNDNVILPVASFFEGLTTRMGQFFEGCWIIIQAVWIIASTWFDENVIQPIVAFFSPIVESISAFFSQLWEDVKKTWKVASTWFNEKVIVPVVTFFEGVWTSVSGFFSQLWDDIVAIWSLVSAWFTDNIIDPVKTAFKTACEAIGEFFSSLWLGIKKGVVGAMNTVISGIESAINRVVRGINNLISGFNKVVDWAADVVGVSWGGVTLLNEVTLARIAIPEYAEGGFPAQGQMFIAREAGAEMVGSIGRRTAVANNDQIVAGIAGGVAEANEEQNALLREQNDLLRALLNKESGVYLDGKNLTNSVEKYQRERGRVLITGGVV
jgi:hypothetical protein